MANEKRKSKAPAEVLPDHEKSGKCAGGCGKKLDDEYFCFGCHTFWCGQCDTEMPFGPHEPEEHQALE